jgi:tricorn protease
MPRFIAIFRSLLVLAVLSSPALGAGNVTLPRYPSISPDGKELIFSWRGDLWKAPVSGGSARRLTSHPADDLQSAWSRDGRRIAFVSNRSGFGNLYLMSADGTGLRQVTTTDRPMGLTGFGVDEQGNEVILLAARLEPEAQSGPRPYMIDPSGGDFRRVHDALGTFPVVSPDGKKVLFNRGGASWSRRGYRGSDSRDVWLFDRTNGSFRQLTSWSGNDGRARWVDNTSFVYSSDRLDNTTNLYLLRLNQAEEDGVRLTRLSMTDVEDWDISADGKTLVYASWDGLYRLNPTDRNPQPQRIELQADEDTIDDFVLKDVARLISDAALSPDGKTTAFIAFGQVYVRSNDAKSTARRVGADFARARDLAWSPDGTKLYFSADLTGTEGIYEVTVARTRSDVRKAVEAVVRPPATLPTTRPSETADAGNETPSTETGEAVPATRPSEAPSESGEPATAPTTATTTTATSPATTTASTRPSDEASRWTDALQFSVRKLCESDQGDTMPSPSPDGKFLAFRRGNGALMIFDLKDETVRTLFDGWSPSLDWRWSPDSRYIAFETEDVDHNSDIFVVPADGKAPPVNVTRHPDSDGNPRWSADSRLLAFNSTRINDESDVFVVWLDKEMEALTPAEIEQYFKDAAAAAKKREPLKPAGEKGTKEKKPDAKEEESSAKKPWSRKLEKLDLEDAYLRIRRVTTLPGDEYGLELTPAGDTYVFTAQSGSSRALFTQARDASEPKRLAGNVTVKQLSLTGEQVLVIDSGRAGLIKLSGGEPEWLDIADKLRVDLAELSRQKFLEAARIIGRQFYDPQMHGVHWEEMTARYLPLALQARTNDEFDWVCDRFVGELNSSHQGINSPATPNPSARPPGRLGIDTKRDASGALVVKRVVRDGPADRMPMRMKVGDRIRAVDGQEITGRTTLDEVLQGRVDREVTVEIERDADGKTVELTLLLTPVSTERLGSILYQEWRNDTAAKVEQWSEGRLGYIHIQSMGQESLDVFERDLFAAADGKEGLIIDVRNNGGGWTTDRLLASIMAPRHAYTLARGVDPSRRDAYPRDRLFIQSYTLPINMLCNEKSFSNAEIISHAFKTLKRGTLVGQTTAGGVISTGGTTLVDGTTVRVPGRGWFTPQGLNMENNGAVPDLIVPQTPEDESREHDAQLKAAVDDLLKRLEKKQG